MGKNNKKLSNETIDKIIKLYSELKSTRKVAKELNITKTTVSRYLKKNGVHLSTTAKSKEEINLINELYEKYGDVQSVANETGFKWETVAKHVKDKNRPRRRKYDYNNNIFEKIDTESKAYWLGFFYADGFTHDSKGYINKCSFFLKFEDKPHVEKFIDFIDGDKELLKIRSDGYVGVDINNKKMATDLYNLGVKPRKSLILKFPTSTIIPPNLLNHFIRGYFDGDGSIFGKPNGDGVCSFIGTVDFISTLKDILIKEVGVIDNKLDFKSDCIVEYKKQGGQAKLVLDYVYRNANIYLDRKYERYALLFRDK